MSNNKNIQATSFWNFINRYEVEIPIIQRDYAQGRFGKENLRKNFLTDLKKALDNERQNEIAVQKLDFVYGSTENDKLYPLDGQQRLTTLWLLHWYIALRAGMLNEDNCAIFQKFTYETRISSREFCQKLCVPDNFAKFDGKDIVGFITKQTWFYSAWKQDPTIQSMLRMLGGTKIADKTGEDIIDGIEELFKCPSECVTDGKVNCAFKRYWKKLVSEDAPIVFYHLPLQDFGLSDDLYIKMNARGKQLTSFENFKADLIGYITTQVENTSLEKSNPAEWKKLLDPEIGIPIKLDTKWTDIFWKNKSIGIKGKDSISYKSNQIDEIYFAFLNRLFWNELFAAKDSKEKYILDIGNGDENSTQENNNSSYKYLNNSEHPNDYDTTIAYEGLDSYRYDKREIPLSFFQKLKRVLDNYFTYSQDYDLPECPWDTSFKFIPKCAVENENNIEIENNAKEKILKVTALNQVQRVVFFAVCKYFDHDEIVSDNENSLKQWMRVVWNLVSGEDHNGRPEIRSTSAMRTAIEFINSLDSHNVYNSLAKMSVLENTSFNERCKEEIAKATYILDESGNIRTYEGSCKKEDGSNYKTWEEIIIETEKYAFFKGSIRFLFTKENIGDDWNNFETKWGNSQKYFDKNGVKEDYKVELTKKLVIQCCDWENQLYDKQIFNPNNSTWKWILCSENWREPINSILTEDLTQIQPVTTNKNLTVQEYFTPLLNDLPFEWMTKQIPDGRFRWLGPRLAYYKPYGREYILFDWEDFKRKEILSKIDVNTDYRINNSCFFWGWDIQFSYNEKLFQWQGNNYVRLIEEIEKCEPGVKDDSRDNTEEKLFCFCPTSEMAYDITKFTAKLDQLINDFQNTKQKEQSRC